MSLVASSARTGTCSTPLEHYPAPAELQDLPPAEDDLRGLIEDTVAGVFDVDAAGLRRPTRGRAKVALARQVAMYIAHVCYGLTLTEVGQLFERDRTTVAHACNVVEQRRDDPRFDAAIQLLDLVIRVLNVSRCTSGACEDREVTRMPLPNV